MEASEFSKQIKPQIKCLVRHPGTVLDFQGWHLGPCSMQSDTWNMHLPNHCSVLAMGRLYYSEGNRMWQTVSYIGRGQMLVCSVNKQMQVEMSFVWVYQRQGLYETTYRNGKQGSLGETAEHGAGVTPIKGRTKGRRSARRFLRNGAGVWVCAGTLRPNHLQQNSSITSEDGLFFIPRWTQTPAIELWSLGMHALWQVSELPHNASPA